MIKYYKYWSKGYGCDVTLGYDDGLLLSVVIDTPAVTGVAKSHFYNTESDFLQCCKQYQIPFKNVERVVTFDMFWERYNYKTSGRIPALKAWEKLTVDEQIAAYDYIPAYETHLKMSRTAKKYGSSFLNSKIYIK